MTNTLCIENETLTILEIAEQGPPGAPGLTVITGLIEEGINVTITGTGTPTDPYVINASGGGGGGSIPTIRIVTSNTNMTLADTTVEGNATGGNFTINLPDSTTAYNSTNKQGQIFNVAKPLAAGQITVGSVNSSDRINGLATITLLQGNLQVQAGPGNTYTIL